MWYIPLNDDVVSVGVVAGYDYLFRDRESKNPETVYAAELDRCPGLHGRLDNATKIESVRVAKEYSYRARDVAGDGWVLVGDAFGFLDPLYSSGILLALKSGELAGDAVVAVTLDKPRRQILRWMGPFTVPDLAAGDGFVMEAVPI